MAHITTALAKIIDDAISRDILDFGITQRGQGPDRMIRGRVTSAADLVKAFKAAEDGAHLWICPVSDAAGPTAGFSAAYDGPRAADIEGLIYTVISCQDNTTREAARRVLAGQGMSDSITLPGAKLLVPLALYTDEIPCLETALRALDKIIGGGITTQVNFLTYYEITGSGDFPVQGLGSHGPDALLRVADIVSNCTPETALYNGFDPAGFDLGEYLADYDVGILDDGGKAEYGTYRRYPTRYGVLLQDIKTGGITLAPYAGSRARTWAELQRLIEGGVTKDGRLRASAAIDRIQKSAISHDAEPDFTDGLWYLEHMDDEESVPRYARTGIKVLDARYRGIQIGGVTVISGHTSQGKSTVLAQMLINMRSYGHRIVIYSGEYEKHDFWRRATLLIAGRDHIRKVLAPGEDPTNPDASSVFKICPDVAEPVCRWIYGAGPEDGTIRLYNSEKLPHSPKSVVDVCTRKLKEINADILVIDNLMKLGLSRSGGDEYNRQHEFFLEMSVLAKTLGIAIIIVAHPSKADGILDSQSIKGASEIGNIVDRVMHVYKAGDGFERDYKDFYRKKCDLKGDGFIAVVKDRSLPYDADLFLPYYYEPGTARILSKRGEFISYDWFWQDMSGQDALQTPAADHDTEGFPITAAAIDLPFQD